MSKKQPIKAPSLTPNTPVTTPRSVFVGGGLASTSTSSSYISKPQSLLQEVRQAMKSFQKLEKEFAPVHTALTKLMSRETEDPNAVAAGTSLSKIGNRLGDVSEKLQASVRTLAASFSEAKRMHSSFQENPQRMIHHKEIIDYLLFRGYVEVAYEMCKKCGFPITLFPQLVALQAAGSEAPFSPASVVFPSSLEEEGSGDNNSLSCGFLSPIGWLPTREQIYQDICLKHELASVMQWCQAHHEALTNFVSDFNLLELKVRIRELLELKCSSSEHSASESGDREESSRNGVGKGEREEGSPQNEKKLPSQHVSSSGGRGMDILQFVATHLLPFAVHHPQFVQDATQCVTANPNTETYSRIQKETSFEELGKYFHSVFLTVMNVERELNKNQKGGGLLCRRKAQQQNNNVPSVTTTMTAVVPQKKEGSNTTVVTTSRMTTGQQLPNLALRCIAGVISLKDLFLVSDDDDKKEREREHSKTNTAQTSRAVAARSNQKSNLQHRVSRLLQSLFPKNVHDDPIVIKRRTRLFCPVTQLEMTDAPLVLPNGTVISVEGLERLLFEASIQFTSRDAYQQGTSMEIREEGGKGNDATLEKESFNTVHQSLPDGHVICPRTGEIVDATAYRKMYIT